MQNKRKFGSDWWNEKPKQYKPTTTREKLAALIEQHFGVGSICKPEWLIVCKGAQPKNDIASWEGKAVRSDGRGVNLHSYKTMTSIVKDGKLTSSGNQFNLEIF